MGRQYLKLILSNQKKVYWFDNRSIYYLLWWLVSFSDKQVPVSALLPCPIPLPRRVGRAGDSTVESAPRSPGPDAAWPHIATSPTCNTKRIKHQHMKTYSWWNSSDKHINSLAQDCSNSSALAKELLQSCTKPSILQSCDRSSILQSCAKPSILPPYGKPCRYESPHLPQISFSIIKKTAFTGISFPTHPGKWHSRICPGFKELW